MMELNENQIAHIEQVLTEKGLRNKNLRAEILDHVCCQVEGRMGRGKPFREALAGSMGTFKEDEMKDIQASCLAIVHQKKYSVMKKVSIAALITMMVICSAHWLTDEERPEITPPLEMEQALLALADPPSTSPLRGEVEVTSGFGMRVHPIKKVKKQHKGVDFKAPMGTPVQATSDGVVVKAKFSPGYGNHIVVQHDEHFQTLYAQLSRMDVKVGDEIRKEEIIGAVGSSGMSTGPHLHYEVIKDGEHQDPEEYLRP